MKTRTGLLIITLLLAVSGCFVSTFSKEWNIEWDKEKVEQKYSFLNSIPENVTKEQPNIILIMADDLGKYEVSAYGAEDIQTPNIDAIGENGVRFQDAYVTAPICAPSRAAILTGRYQQRYGFETQPMDFYPTNKLEYGAGKRSELGEWVVTSPPEFPSPWMMERQGVPPDEINLAELLSSAGYETGIIGKWHLGYGAEHIPNHRGFDYQFGFYGAFSLYTPSRKTEGYVNYIQNDLSSKHQWNMGRNENSMIRENDKPVKEDEYLTFALKNKAVKFIRDHKEKPFFLYLPFSAPHVPFQAPKEYYDQFSHVADSNRRVYLSMIKALDDAVGDLMNALKREGLWENTIVYFISDNGGASYTRATTNGPLKGGKITHFEGGINVPFLMQWPKMIKNSSAYIPPVSAMDIFTTTLCAAGVQLPKGRAIDGVDLMPFLRGERQGQPHDRLYWRTDHIHAIRDGKYKLIYSSRDNWLHLYDLETDKSEKYDLSGVNSVLKESLLRYFTEWNNELPNDYLWPRIMDRKFVIGNEEYLFPA